MKLSGITKSREKLPGYTGKKVALIPVLAAISFILGLLFLLFLDGLPRFLGATQVVFPELFLLEPLLPILGSILLVGCGFTLVWSFWWRKKNLLHKNPKNAYEKAFLGPLLGIPLFISVIAYSYIPLDTFPYGVPANPSTSMLSK